MALIRRLRTALLDRRHAARRRLRRRRSAGSRRSLLAPLFNDFEQLPAGPDPRDAICGSGARPDVDIGEVYRVDASRRSTGAQRLRRRPRADQARRPLRQHDPRARARPSCDSVVAHELGHVKRDDILRGIAFVALVAPLGVLFVQLLSRGLARPQRRRPALARRCCRRSRSRSRSPRSCSAFAGKQLSRQVEARADTFALELTHDPAGLHRAAAAPRADQRLRPRSARPPAVPLRHPSRRRWSGSAPPSPSGEGVAVKAARCSASRRAAASYVARRVLGEALDALPGAPLRVVVLRARRSARA